MTAQSHRDRREAFERFYRAHHDALLAYAKRRADAEVANDVVAEVFLAAWRRYDESSQGGLPWLYRTAHLCLSNQARMRQRQFRTTAKLQAQPVISQIDPASAIAERVWVLQGLSRLSPGDQELLRLVYWEQLAVKDAAMAMGCSASGASVRLHRARRRLRKSLVPVAVEPAVDRCLPHFEVTP